MSHLTHVIEPSASPSPGRPSAGMGRKRRKLQLRQITGVSTALFLLASPLAAAAQKPAAKVPTHVLRSVEAPFFPATMGSLATGGEPPQLLVELDRAPSSDAELQRIVSNLEATGVRVERVQGKPLAYQRFVVVTADSDSLRRVARLTSVSRVLPALHPGVPSLDRSAALLGIPSVRGSRPGVGDLTGSGVVLADVDSLADIFHPDFFRGDAGYFDWIDVDQDGSFEVGIDAVDLNRDGEADASEIARLLRATPKSTRSNKAYVGVRSDGFDPSIDWVYLDEDGNGERNHGSGFAEDIPAFGEPLFVPDDVNGDGVIGPAERFVRLGSSKFRKVFAQVNYLNIKHNHVYERGVDLSKTPVDITHGVYTYSDAYHATAVLSIAAGGVPLPSRRWVGIAPNADLLLAFGLSNSVTAPVVWALSENPDVVLHEQSTWTSVPMDGSDGWSKLIDTSSGDGVINVCPTGNLGGARKHASIQVAKNTTGEMKFNIPADTQTIDVTMHVRGGLTATLSLREPDGTLHPLTGAATLSAGGQLLSSGHDVTDGGTHVYYNHLRSPAAGDYAIDVKGDPAATALVHGFVADEAGFAVKTAWDPSIATDANTAAVPSVASTCVGVGAVPSHLSSEGIFADVGDEAQGELRAYSGRGPRIDGAPVLDLVAPDNPWVSAPEGELYPDYPGYSSFPHGGIMIFGGTSGAAPHAAGLAVLLAQAGQPGAAAIEALRTGAVEDKFTGTVPNADYGYGRLSAAGSFGVPLDGASPTIELRADPAGAAPGESVLVTPIATDNQIRVRWDEGYDGVWDSELSDLGGREFTQGNEPLRLKVQAWSGNGRIAEAALLVPLQPTSGVGGSGGSGVGGEATAGAAGNSNASGGASGNDDDSGCGCVVPGRRGAKGAGWIALAGLALLVGRRRKS